MSQAKKATLITLAIMMSVANYPSIAAPKDSPATVVYDDPTGATVEFNADGSGWVRIRAVGESSCVICDRMDIQAATRKATLSAKSEIAKFLKEKVSTTETMDSMLKTMTGHNGQAETVNRKSVETLITSISNSAEAILKGVLTLESRSIPAEKYVKVTVGVSKKTMKAADSIRNDMDRDLSKPRAADLSSANHTSQSPVDLEVKRSRNYNNF